jgi:hypothetical protein
MNENVDIKISVDDACLEKPSSGTLRIERLEKNIALPFVIFSLAIVLFVFSRFWASDYTLAIFKPFNTISVRYITPFFISRVVV